MKRTITTMSLCLLFLNPNKSYTDVKGIGTKENNYNLKIIKTNNNIKYVSNDDKIAFEFNIYLKSIKDIIKTNDQISIYDSLIKVYSKEIDWDWRLFASLIYQESRFNTKAKSPVGAYGLMQMMPLTQKFFGIESVSPELQIAAGAKYIKFLNIMFKNSITNCDERIKFILASYNIGAGHIYDAQRLAVKQHRNPYKWFNNVEKSLLSKSLPENYNDSINVRNGYCSGIETVNFVPEIMNRYKMFKKYYN
jgi:membrane-bound lytic murein transglycosylase F